MGPPLTKQETYLLNKLVKTGYNGENWPWPEMPPVQLTEKQVEVIKKVLSAPLESHPRKILSQEEQSIYDGLIRTMIPKDFYALPEQKKKVAEELSDPKIVGEQLLQMRAKLNELLTPKAERTRRRAEKRAKKAAEAKSE